MMVQVKMKLLMMMMVMTMTIIIDNDDDDNDAYEEGPGGRWCDMMVVLKTVAAAAAAALAAAVAMMLLVLVLELALVLAMLLLMKMAVRGTTRRIEERSLPMQQRHCSPPSASSEMSTNSWSRTMSRCGPLSYHIALLILKIILHVAAHIGCVKS